jgi:hypothetical protein
MLRTIVGYFFFCNTFKDPCFQGYSETPNLDCASSRKVAEKLPKEQSSASCVLVFCAQHLAALAHLNHSIELTVLRCYLEAVLGAPLVQAPTDG